jgi:hypothetical protein
MRLNSGNACRHSVQNLLSFRLLSRNINIKIHKTIILSAVLYGCGTWFVTLREDYSLVGLRTGCGGEYLDLKGMKYTGS